MNVADDGKFGQQHFTTAAAEINNEDTKVEIEKHPIQVAAIFDPKESACDDEEEEEEEQQQPSSDDDDDKVSNSSTLTTAEDDPSLETLWNILLQDLWQDDNPRVVAQGLQSLVETLDTTDCDTLHARVSGVCDLGGPFAVLHAAEQWPLDAAIQAHVCTVFALVSNDPDTFRHVLETTTMTTTMGAAGGGPASAEVGELILQTVARAMTAWPRDEAVQRSGCCVLARSCSGEVASNKDAYYPIVVRELGGIGLVTGAMLNFPSSAGVQQWACWALYMFSLWRRNRAPIVQAGGFGLLAFALDSNPKQPQQQGDDNACFQNAARSTLRRLAGTTRNESTIVDETTMQKNKTRGD